MVEFDNKTNGEGIVDYFKTRQVTNSVTRITGVTGEQMYLIQGTRRAVLVDTGCGIGDLSALVTQMTRLPVTVILTHGHLDHALGARPFDDVLMHPADIPVFEAHSRLDYRLKFFAAYLGENFRYMEKDLVPALDVSRFKSVREGDVFDLGGLHLTVYECAGHTPGSICILIQEERLLITGDAANFTTYMFMRFCTSIPVYRKSLVALKEKTTGTYDMVLLSHGGNNGDTGMIDDVIESCDHILSGLGTNASVEFVGEIGYFAMEVDEQHFRLDGRQGNVVFRKNNCE